MLKLIKEGWRQDKDRRNLWFVVLYALGIAVYFSLKFEPNKWIAVGIAEGLIVLAIIFRHHLSILRVLSCLAIAVAGFSAVQLKTIWLAQNNSQLPDDTFYFKGKIENIDTNYQGRKRFILTDVKDFDGNSYKGKYRITQRSSKEEANIGECVEMVGKIMPLSKEVMVGGYQFDRKGFFEGLKGSGFAESRWFKIDCETKSAFDFNAFIGNLRYDIANRIKNILPKEEASIASAIIAGERGDIDSRQYENYRNSGLAHFLSISGLHMSMLAGLMFFFIRFVLAFIPDISLKFDTKKISAVFAIIISFIYLLISGQAIPAERAFIMTFVVLLGVLFNRRAISMQTICLAGFIVLLLSPQVLVSASFQMSFAAVMGLVAFYEKTSNAISRFLNVGTLHKYIRIIILYVLGVVISDFIASLMTLPFAVYHFNMVAVYTTLGNFLAGPIIGLIIMPMVLLSMLFMPFGLDGIFLKALGYGINQVNQITEYVSSLPNSAVYVPSMPHWGLVLIVLGGLWLMLWQAKWKYFGIIGVVLGLLSITTAKVPDIIIGPDAKAVAFKNLQGELEIASSRGGRFIKDVWKNKYKVSKYKSKLSEHSSIDVSYDKVIYNNKTYNLDDEIGMSIYIDYNGVSNVITIRDDIGNRPWNSAN
ncbi:MAG: ComEC family competence protein [Alphaproteobacteria bacterium]|nr:ComEC family competence protein [Alphaproteobacteria bacterium]